MVTFLRRLKTNFAGNLHHSLRKGKRGKRLWLPPWEDFRLAWNLTKLEMKTLAVLAAVVLLASPAVAQPGPKPCTSAPDGIVCPMNLDEQAAFLQVCEMAKWASRMQAETACDYFKRKFVAPVDPAKAAPPK